MFLYSGLPKIRQSYDFLGSVYGYQLVGPAFGLIVAMILPWLEVGIGICLVGGVLVAGSLLISIALSAVFTFVIASALHRGLSISCGCFGSSPDDTINVLTLVRAIGILLLSVLAYLGTILPQPSSHTSRVSIKTGGLSPTPPGDSTISSQFLPKPV